MAAATFVGFRYYSLANDVGVSAVRFAGLTAGEWPAWRNKSRTFGAAGSLLGSCSDEAKLVERARTQPEAFGQLYDRYYSVVLNYIFRRTLDVALAEELTSNTFFNALRALGGYENRGKFLAWLYRIAGNEIRLNWRARRKQHEGEARWRAELGRVRFATDRAIATEEVEEQARQFARLHEAT